jgi:hypothetical protein
LHFAVVSVLNREVITRRFFRTLLFPRSPGDIENAYSIRRYVAQPVLSGHFSSMLRVNNDVIDRYILHRTVSNLRAI